MPKVLHIDIETYSSEDISSSGVYKYCEAVDFEILLVAFAFDKGPKQIIDLAQGEILPKVFIQALLDPEIEKHAHNAAFERTAFKAFGYNVPINQWRCSMVKAAYCGLPLSLGAVSEALGLGEKGKMSTGKALIRYFCMPCKPTKVNGGRLRNFPEHDLEKWEDFKTYCLADVEAEREIGDILKDYEITPFEREMYVLDQEINDRGIYIDIPMVNNMLTLNDEHAGVLFDKMQTLTKLDNPNSVAQLKQWLSDEMQEEVTTLAKGDLPDLLERAESTAVAEVIELRRKSSKTSIKKYEAMLKCVTHKGRAHGLFQFYGANRTGRWAGRLIQLQNLPQNHLDDLAFTRETFAFHPYQTITLLYENISSVMSQLIRTAFIAEKGKTFAVADFSAIEARVIAWLAGETWRLDVFKTHGKIYEASAAMMFGMKVEDIEKGSPERQKGKVAELALGYQGSVGALKQMGAEEMGLSETEMKTIVNIWRRKSPNIVKLWAAINNAAIRAIKTKKKIILPNFKGLLFHHDGKALTIQLPSGRKLFYQEAILTTNEWDKPSIKYKGMDQTTKKWTWVRTYGGKLTENIVQAIARDLLALSMWRLDVCGFDIVMHVHDEAVCEIIDDLNAPKQLKEMCEIMGDPVPWAEGLPLAADGYITKFYKKD